MSFKEIMLLLAREWVIGYSVSTALCIIGYLVFSTLLVRSCRKINYDVGVSGMIPIWNIVVLIRRVIKGKKLKPISEDEEIVL